MTDLFNQQPTTRPGEGNARFLADLAERVPDQTMRAKFKAGHYPDLHTPSLAGWRRMAGRG